MKGPICKHRGITHKKGQESLRPIIHWKNDVNSNPISQSNQNSILDTSCCEVEFLGGEITELASNIIAELMYVQCDNNGNGYLLLEVFANHRKNDSALGVEDQKRLSKGKIPLESH